jgi:hypothetical protein
MTLIYSNDSIKIKEDKIKSIFTIEFFTSNKILIDSLIKTRIIQGATSTEDYREIKFKAQSVKPLLKFKEEQLKQSGAKTLPINLVAEMIFSLSIQLNHISSINNHTILGYSPENIIVINEKKFAFLGSEYVTKIEEDGKILVSYPFTSNEFYISPELLKIKELPSYVHYKTSYFSLACLVLNTLLSDEEFNEGFYENYLKNNNPGKIIDQLNNHPIKNTKLYWLLSRCLIEDPKKRSILLI